jgi:tetratricopeptide (TPR) repeat protein
MYQEAIADFSCASIFAVKQDDKINLQKLAHESANQLLFSRLGASGKDSAFEALARLPLEEANRIVQTTRLDCSSFTTSFLIDEAAELVEKRYAAMFEAKREANQQSLGIEVWINPKAAYADKKKDLQKAAEHHIRNGSIVEALRVHPRYARAWKKLGDTLSGPQDGHTVEVNGQVVGQQQCFLTALEIDARDSEAWSGLAYSTSSSQVHTIYGRVLPKEQCFVRALELDEQNAKAWIGIAVPLKEEEESVQISGRQYNKRQCCLKCLELDHANALAWINLGNTLVRGEQITIEGQQYTSQQCFLKGLRSTTKKQEKK